MLYSGKGINPDHLVSYVIRPVLQHFDPIVPYSTRAEKLLLATAWIESHCGQNLKQEPGPARGMWQMEPATADLVHHQLTEKQDYLLGRLRLIRFPAGVNEIANLHYSCGLARFLYWFEPSAIPDEAGMYDYYLKVWRPGKPRPRSVFNRGLSLYV